MSKTTQNPIMLGKLACLALLLAASPALAERGPGLDGSPRGAIAARTIGLMCAGSLESADIYDLDLYLSWKRIASAKANGLEARQEWLANSAFEHAAVASYRDPKTCTATVVEQARETVDRVRRELTGSCAQDGCFDP